MAGIAGGYSMAGGSAPAAGAGYQMGGGWGGVPGAAVPEFQQGRPGQAPMQHALSTGQAKTLKQAQYEAYMAKYFPERRPQGPVPGDPGGARPFLIEDRRLPDGTYVPPGGGGFGGSMAPPYLPSMQSASDLQEPLQAGMFEGSITFLSAEVDPNGSEMAADAIARFDIRGENIVRGLFRRRRAVR
jgi:hypothetical protein